MRDPDRSWITDSNSDHAKGTHRTKAGKLPRSRHCQPNENQRQQSVMRTLSLAKMKRRSIWRKHKRQKTHLRKEHQTALTAAMKVLHLPQTRRQRGKISAQLVLI